MDLACDYCTYCDQTKSFNSRIRPRFGRQLKMSLEAGLSKANDKYENNKARNQTI